MRPIALLALVLLACAALCAEAPLLSRLTVHATGPVSVTVPTAEPPADPIYRAQDGSWQSLATEYVDGRVSFDIPAETGGSTVVLLRVPQWLNLEDDAAPVADFLEVDGRPVGPAAEVNLGHLSGDALRLTLTVTDAENPIDVGCAMVVLDGTPLSEEQATFLPAEGDRRSRTLQVSLADLKPDLHTLRVSVPDAAALPHVAEVRVTFNTAPLLADGGFEKLDAKGGLVHWVPSMWSQDAATKAEVKVASGARSGEHCAELTGIAGSLNLLWGQQVALAEGRKYKVSGYYKATVPRGCLSLIGDGSAAKQQYITSPTFPASEDWAPFEWTFTADPVARWTLYLRNASVGSVWFDDLVLEEIAAE